MKTGLKRCFVVALLVFYGFTVFAQKPHKASSAPRLHVIYMLEQEDPAYGLLNLKNDELMTEITRTVEWALGYPMQLTYLSKRDFTQAVLKRTIAGLKTRPNDIIILYYSGFGIVSGKSTINFSNWKLHDTPMQGLAVGEVEKWLLAKNVHLRLLIADCTAQFLANNEPVLSKLVVEEDPRKRVIKRLFLTTCGLVKMGSSLPTVPAWTVASGGASAFTKSLNSAFQELLLSRSEAEIASISFQKLTAITERELQATLYNRPFKQDPVLEINSCQNVAKPTVRRATIDPLAVETLNGQLNALAFSGDSLQTIPIRERLIGLSQDEAVVEVRRYLLPDGAADLLSGNFPSDTDSTWREDVRSRKTYSMATYLNQIRKPLMYRVGDSVQTIQGFFRRIIVTNMEVDRMAPKPIKRLVVRENWK